MRGTTSQCPANRKKSRKKESSKSKEDVQKKEKKINGKKERQ